MKQPTRNDYLLGARTTCMAIWGATALLTLAWLSGSGEVPWLMPLLGAGVGFRALKAKREVEAFTAWQQDWNALAGEPQQQEQPQAPPPSRKKYGAVWLWGFTVLLLVGNHQPLTARALDSPDGIAFMAMSLWLARRILWKAIRGQLQTRTGAVATKPRAERQHVVQLCLPVPRHSPSVEQAVAALPAYCHALLRRQPDGGQQRLGL